jgi:5-methylcytosine-specific restriction enzyme A
LENSDFMPTIKLLKRKRDDVRTERVRDYQEIYQDKRWKKLRAWKMRNNPLCELCEARGKVVQMEEVHHLIPFDSGATKEEVEELAFDYDNLESLCEKCHEERHKELK